MGIKKKILVLLLICFSKIFAIENYERFEDSYIRVKAKNLENDFFMIKYDYSTEESYIGVNALIYFLELYTLEVDIEKRLVFGELNNHEIKVHFLDEESFVTDDELYVDINSLKKKLFFRQAEFDFSSLMLNLEPDFLLPYEERERGRVERLRLDSRRIKDNKKLDFEMPRKLITPGLFKIDYVKSDIKESDYQLNYEYASQFLYGELYLSGEINPKTELDYGNLTYSDIVGENDLVFGHFYLNSPDFLDIDTKVLGVSFDDNETYLTRDSGKVIIKGVARNVDTIELYRNSYLIDYVKSPSENFKFEVEDGVYSSDYTLKIYYKNGSIEERKVYTLSDLDLLNKGKSRFSFQGGESDRDKYSQYVGKAFYGLTDNLTVGVGGLNLTSSDGKEHKIVENDILFRTGTSKLPLLVDFKNYYDYDKKENSYELDIEQKIYSYSLRFTENKYSDYVTGDGDTKKYNSISIGKSFNRNFFEFGFDKRLYKKFLKDELTEKNAYGVWDSSFFNPFYTSLRIEKNIDGGDGNISYMPSITYSKYNGISIILDGDISKDDNDKKYKQDYHLRVNWRKQDLMRDTLSFDVGADISYNNETHETRYGINFNIELDDIIYMRLDTDKYKDSDGKAGLQVSKIVDLSDPTRKIKRNISLNSSWIYGKVFLDRNGNGIYDEGETVLPNVAVKVDNIPFYSDKNGEYVAEGFYSNEEVILDVDRKTLDPMMKNSKGALKIKTRKSSGAKIDIPVETVSMIMGNIWNTEDFTEREFIRHISLTTIILEKDGEIVKEIDPEFDGMFFFEDVTPGKYLIKFEYLGDDNIGFTNNAIPINVTLQNPEEGEYFEENDTALMRVEEVTESEEKESDEVEEIISNY